MKHFVVRGNYGLVSHAIDTLYKRWLSEKHDSLPWRKEITVEEATDICFKDPKAEDTFREIVNSDPRFRGQFTEHDSQQVFDRLFS